MAKILKICFALPVHPMYKVGGAELQAYYLANEFVRLGWQVSFITQDLGTYTNDYDNPDIQIHKIKKDSILKLLSVKRIYDALKKSDADVYYQRIGGIFTGVTAYYCRRFNKLMVWACAHDAECCPNRAQDEVKSTYWFKEGKIARNVLGLINAKTIDMFGEYGIQNSEICLAQTEYQKSILKRNFNIRSIVIKNGHYLNNIPKPTEKQNIVLWVANIRRVKHPEVFIEIAQRFKHTNWEFVMIGAPSKDREWMNLLLLQMGQTPNLEYLGFQPLEIVKQYMSKSKLLVNTSESEGFSNTFIEAWQNYTPVVSLSVDPDNIIRINQLGKVSGSFEQILQDINALMIDHKLRDELAANGYEYVMREHDIVKNARQLDRIIKGSFIVAE